MNSHPQIGHNRYRGFDVVKISARTGIVVCGDSLMEGV